MFEYKEIGETTSEFSNRIKNKLNCKKVCIIGKLDPMAQGYTRILIDSETKLMNKYLNSDKNYTFSIVIGFSTDTDDIMGKIEKINSFELVNSNKLVNSNELVNLVTNEIRNYCLCTIQKFHRFSAIKINKNGINTSLHSINNLSDEDIPEKEIKVYDLIQLNNYNIINSIKYKELIFERLNKVNDKKTFRIDEIKDLYMSNLLFDNKFNMISIDYNITVSSGFYIRMIANHIKNKLNIPVHIYNISRVGALH